MRYVCPSLNSQGKRCIGALLRARCLSGRLTISLWVYSKPGAFTCPCWRNCCFALGAASPTACRETLQTSMLRNSPKVTPTKQSEARPVHRGIQQALPPVRWLRTCSMQQPTLNPPATPIRRSSFFPQYCPISLHLFRPKWLPNHRRQPSRRPAYHHPRGWRSPRDLVASPLRS